MCSLRPSDSCIPGEAAERHKQLWGVLRDKQVQNVLILRCGMWYFRTLAMLFPKMQVLLMAIHIASFSYHMLVLGKYSRMSHELAEHE